MKSKFGIPARQWYNRYNYHPFTMNSTNQITTNAVVVIKPAGIGESLNCLLEKLNSRAAKVAVVGMGYVGLPLALEASKSGYKTTGFDIDPEKVEQLNSGISYVKDISSDELSVILTNYNFSASSDLSLLSEFDVIIIAVPTPLNKSLVPDLSYIEAAGYAVAQNMRPGTLVSLESTTYPGTTEEVLLPILESTGLVEGVDFVLVHSPERVDPGNKKYSTKNTPKIIGGISEKSLYIAQNFYESIVESVVLVSDTKTAELVKVYENVFRAVNVALSNELALLCDRMGINVWEVIEAANTKPFGIMKFLPGPGVGGHCIPLDPHYLEYKAREYHFNTRFITAAGEINRYMPRFVVEKVTRGLNELGIALSRSKILILGVSYKKDIDDYRESPALEIIKLLEQNQANVIYHDPFVCKITEPDLKMCSTSLTVDLIQSVDIVVICTDHTTINYSEIVENSKMILDTRNALGNFTKNREKIRLI